MVRTQPLGRDLTWLEDPTTKVVGQLGSLKARFWTLSAWSDRAALDDFVRRGPHAPTMRKYRPHMRDARFRFWTVPATTLPVDWADAKARLTANPGHPAGSGVGS